MSYQALYRVWRPQRFSDVVGQEHITQTLQNALTSGRLSHAYLFNGPRGTGKTSAAKIFAKAVNCLNGPSSEPCNECHACKGITSGALMDVVEIDAASNRGVDEIRDLRDKVKYAPTEVRYKVYIIDEVHMLTTEAFNALLKTLEEPPAHILFILATTEPQKLPLTIISRCQRFSFRRIPLEAIVERLREVCSKQSIDIEESALTAVARIADGGLRDALSILDQCLGLCDNRLEENTVYKVTGTISRESIATLIEASMDQDIKKALTCLDQSVADGFDPEKMMDDLICGCRDLLMLQKCPSMVEGTDPNTPFTVLSEKAGSSKLLIMLDTLISYQGQMKWTPYPRVLLEVVLIRLCTISIEKKEEVLDLEKRIADLEKLVQSWQKPEIEIAASQEQEPSEQRAKPKKNSLEKEWNSPEQLAKVKERWSNVLQRVKEEKITVHAWLVDGEVVGAKQDSIMVAFQSKIHRDTTEKEANRTIIENVIADVFGQTFQLKTCMVDDWGRASLDKQDVLPKQDHPEVDIVAKAIEIFGEDLVEVVSSTKGD